MMPILLKAKWLIDGTGRAPIANGRVLVADGVIAAVGEPNNVPTPPGIQVLDIGDGTLLPGLIDVHSHLSLDMSRGDVEAQLKEQESDRLIRGVEILRRNLKAGITTMRLCGESRNFIDVTCKRAVEDGRLYGPRLLVSGKALSPSHGHGVSAGVDGVEDVRLAVRQNIRAGADLIKILVTGGIAGKHESPFSYFYSPEEITVTVEEAHRAGKRVAAHAHGGPGLRYCLEVGVDTIEHGAYVSNEDIALFIEKKTWLVATFGVIFHPDGLERAFAHVPYIVQKVHHARKDVDCNIKNAIDAGVRYTLGTDSMQGRMAFEIEHLVGLGVKPLDAIVAATKNAAECCGLESRTGTLEPGKWADIISVLGNPLDDITALERIHLVMKAGQRYDQISFP
ncbi:hypothetical protein ANRL3_02764 [Anaerolineae bacterium]|nr:hypothetical protein ANRL3_02764 [Anaerolineae bacterium]